MKHPITNHILTNASTMVGVCVTSISLVKIVEGRIGPSHVDEYLSINSLLFLVSVLSSYISLRFDNRPRLEALAERIADLSFMFGLCVISLIAVLFAYELI